MVDLWALFPLLNIFELDSSYIGKGGIHKKVYFLQNKLVLSGGSKDFIVFILFLNTTHVLSIDLQ